MPFKRIAIFGPGLLGGSLALALRERFPATRIAIWGRREEAVRTVTARCLADHASTVVAEVAQEAELVVLCVPVERMESLAAELIDHLPTGAIVTDVGSVKGVVLEKVAPVIRPRGRFVGSHPMAGSELEGLDAARSDLFEGAVCLVTPDPGAGAEEVRLVGEFWSALGGRVRELSVAEHDRAAAWISHLPHLVAAALMNLVEEKAPGAVDLCGNGFRDTTRVAAGPDGMWTEIFRHNRAALRESTEAMIEKLHEFATLLDGFDEAGVRARLNAARTARDRLRKP